MCAAPTPNFSGKVLSAPGKERELQLMTSSNSLIRPIRAGDKDSVLQILADSPEAASWSSSGYEQLLNQTGVVALLAEANSSISGFIVAHCVVDEAEILNLAVAPASRRSGYGGSLLIAALQEFQNRGVTRVFLEVRASNAPAIAFYQQHGFIRIGRRTAYYRNPDEDALILEKKLTAGFAVPLLR